MFRFVILQSIKYCMKTIRRILVLFALAAFLVPVSGIMVFVHHCRSMETTGYSLDGYDACCHSSPSVFVEHKAPACDVAHPGHCTHHTFIDGQTCCSDSRIYVKIVLDYLASHDYSPLVASEIILPGIVNPEPANSFFLKRLYTQLSHSPPGPDPWLRLSNLRL